MIYQHLKNLVLNELEENAKLPSENELCSMFNLTRATARQGIGKLKNEGLIYSKKGSGYFVAPSKIPYTISQYTSFSEQIQKAGCEPSMKILECEYIKADAFLADKMQTKKGAKILKLSVLRLVDDIPFLLASNYLNHEKLPNIENYLDGIFSLTEVFKEHYDIHLVRDYSDLEITPCDEKESEILEIQNTLPLIKISSCSFDRASGDVIEYVESSFRSDRAKIFIKFANKNEVSL